jgi:flagellar biogenesis protein FliO
MEMARQVVSVLAVFALLGAVLWTLRNGGLATFRRRRGFRVRRGRQLESIERLTLTAQHSLHLIRIGEKEVVVATHPHGCALLTDQTAAHSYPHGGLQ